MRSRVLIRIGLVGIAILGALAAGAEAEGPAAAASEPPACEGGVFAGSEGVTYPVLIPASRVVPKYPRKARKARREGQVLLQALIGKDGTVSDVKVLRSGGERTGFDQAATEAVRRWRYEPARRGSTPVAVCFTVVVEFRLDEDRGGGKSAPRPE